MSKKNPYFEIIIKILIYFVSDKKELSYVGVVGLET